MKFAFMAQTAYQLMNMIRFVYYDTEDSKGNSVIFINEKVASGLNKEKELTASGLFNKVILYNDIKYNKISILGKLETAINVVNREAFGKLLKEHDESYEAETVVVASVSLESQIFWQYIKHEKVYLVEDGLGSLMGDAALDAMHEGRRKLTQLIYGPFRFDKMYLNNLNFNISASDTEFSEIPGEYSDQLCDFLRKIFLPDNYKGSYSDNDIIYLQQPVSLWDHKYPEVEKELLYKCLDILDDRFIIRCHPLTVNDPKIKGIRYDLQNYSWETVCIDQISDRNILIGVFSTAQFTPKQIFGREPYVIFIHKIIKPTGLDHVQIDRMIGKLIESYDSRNRILVPETTEELLVFLKKAENEL